MRKPSVPAGLLSPTARCAMRKSLYAGSRTLSPHSRNRGPLASRARGAEAGIRRGPHLSGSRPKCHLVVPRVFCAQSAARSSTRTLLASPRHLSVSNHFARQPATYAMHAARGKGGEVALGGSVYGDVINNQESEALAKIACLALPKSTQGARGTA